MSLSSGPSGGHPITFSSFAAPRYYLRLDALELACSGLSPGHFIEIGAGRGDFAAWLISRGGVGTLAERSPMAAEYLRRRFRGLEGVTVLEGDASALPGGDAQGFDTALALEVLEHVPDDAALARRCHDLLVPGGRFIVTAPAFRSCWTRLDDFAGHLRRYEESEITGLLSYAGFTEIRLTCSGFPASFGLRAVRQAYYSRKMRLAGRDSASSRTDRSGIDKPLQVRGKLLPLVFHALLWPMLLVQRTTLEKRIGDGWVAVARRPS